MSATDRVRRAGSVVALAFCLAIAGCGGEAQQDDAASAAGASTAPAVGPEEDLVRLSEGVTETVSAPESEATVQIAGFENGDEPVVVLEVGQGGEPAATHRLSLGDTVEFGGEAWRLSEIGISDSLEQPGSATLVRADED